MGNLFRWFKSYVDNRSQTVLLNGYLMLGPLLFKILMTLIAVFDIPKYSLYASTYYLLQEDLEISDVLYYR